jgi:hypothetical protein
MVEIQHGEVPNMGYPALGPYIGIYFFRLLNDG